MKFDVSDLHSKKDGISLEESSLVFLIQTRDGLSLSTNSGKTAMNLMIGHCDNMFFYKNKIAIQDGSVLIEADMVAHKEKIISRAIRNNVIGFDEYIYTNLNGVSADQFNREMIFVRNICTGDAAFKKGKDFLIGNHSIYNIGKEFTNLYRLDNCQILDFASFNDKFFIVAKRSSGDIVIKVLDSDFLLLFQKVIAGKYVNSYEFNNELHFFAYDGDYVLMDFVFNGLDFIENTIPMLIDIQVSQNAKVLMHNKFGLLSFSFLRGEKVNIRWDSDLIKSTTVSIDILRDGKIIDNLLYNYPNIGEATVTLNYAVGENYSIAVEDLTGMNFEIAEVVSNFRDVRQVAICGGKYIILTRNGLCFRGDENVFEKYNNIQNCLGVFVLNHE